MSRLSRMPITVLVGIDTANIPPAMAKATKANAPLASSQNSGAAAAEVTAPHQAALRRRRWWSRVPRGDGRGAEERADRDGGGQQPERALGQPTSTA